MRQSFQEQPWPGAACAEFPHPTITSRQTEFDEPRFELRRRAQAQGLTDVEGVVEARALVVSA